jgi:hypothetical protein
MYQHELPQALLKQSLSILSYITGLLVRPPPMTQLEQARKNLEQELSGVLEQMRECGMRLKSVEVCVHAYVRVLIHRGVHSREVHACIVRHSNPAVHCPSLRSHVLSLRHVQRAIACLRVCVR